MFVRHKNRQKGWTLLELLLVLICIASLTTVMIYSFMSSIQQQKTVLHVSTNINRLVDAAHTWRHQGTSYHGVSLDVLKQQGELPDNWPDDYLTQQKNFNLAVADDKSSQCQNGNCFAITFNTGKRDACLYAKNLVSTGVVTITPSLAFCNKDEEQQQPATQVTVVYE